MEWKIDKFPLYECVHCKIMFNRTIVSTGWPEYILNQSSAFKALVEIAWKGGKYCIGCCQALSTLLIFYLWKTNH